MALLLRFQVHLSRRDAESGESDPRQIRNSTDVSDISASFAQNVTCLPIS